ncbi:MAG: histidine phosphatase family protein [Maritimibacter sp.]
MYPELIVMRHGQTEWNLAGRWQGGLDSQLTEKGRDQAVAMGEILRREGITAASHKTYVSPMGRTRETAELALGDGWARVEDTNLREIGVGGWEGWLVKDIERAAGLPEDSTMFDYYSAAPDGEGFEALRERVLGFLATLTGPSLLITHGMTSRMIRTLATGRDLDRLDELPGGQGVVFRLRDGNHEILTP